MILFDSEGPNELQKKENNLDATYYRESGEKAHGSSDETQLGVKLDLLVALDLVKGCRGKVDLDELKGRLWNLFS